MAGYSAWRLLSGLRTGIGKIPSDRPFAFVADFEPTGEWLLSQFGRFPNCLLLPHAPVTNVKSLGVRWGTFRTRTNPLEWGADFDAELQNGLDTVVLALPAEQIRGKTLLALRRAGVRRVLLPSGAGWIATGPAREARRLALAKVAKSAWARVGFRGCAEGSPASFWNHVESAPKRRYEHAVAGLPVDRSLRVVHYVNALNSGGAERQAVVLAGLQKQAGIDAELLLQNTPVGADGHYLPLAQQWGLTPTMAGACVEEEVIQCWRKSPAGARLHKALRAMDRLPPELRTPVLDLFGELLARRPDVFQAYVDDCCVVGLIAAKLAGVPATVLSFRNGIPERFPGLWRPWMKSWYQSVRDDHAVTFSANSQAGARDYEQWLGLSAGSIAPIKNAFIPFDLPSRPEIMQFRQSLEVPDSAPVLAGVFRLHDEKRPLDFLQIVKQVAQKCPNLHVLVAGTGPLSGKMEDEANRLGLRKFVKFLGQRTDIGLILSASDGILLVSRWEGTPNVVLEAQYAGCVPVVMDAGGTREAIEAGKTAELVATDDWVGAVDAVVGVLTDRERSRQRAAAGRDFVRDRFAPERCLAGHLELYRRALQRSGAPWRHGLGASVGTGQ